MILEDDSTTRDINDYKVQCRWIESFLTPRETKLFITMRNKIALLQHPKFPVPDNYEFREEKVRKAMNILRSRLNLKAREFWYLGIHEKGGLASQYNSAHVHVVVDYDKEINEVDLEKALKIWESYLSKEFGLDVCYRLDGEKNGFIPIQSQQKVSAYMAKKEPCYASYNGYKPFLKKPFLSKNWDKWRFKTSEEEVVASNAIEKRREALSIPEPIEEEIEETIEPIVSKKNQSSFLNWDNVILIGGFVSVFYHLLFKKK